MRALEKRKKKKKVGCESVNAASSPYLHWCPLLKRQPLKSKASHQRLPSISIQEHLPYRAKSKPVPGGARVFAAAPFSTALLGYKTTLNWYELRYGQPARQTINNLYSSLLHIKGQNEAKTLLYD